MARARPRVVYVALVDVAADPVCLALVKQASWDEYSEERKKEIEAFYTLEQTE